MQIYFFLIAVIFASQAIAKTPQASVCVLPISADAVVDEMSGAPRELVGKKLPAYSVQIDNGKITSVDTRRTICIAVPVKGRHLVKIFANNTLEHSFYFKWSEFNARRLTLGMSEVGYQTWMLR